LDGIFQEAAYRYYDTGESYIGKPARIVFSDPIIYLAADGRQLIPTAEWGGNMGLKDSLNLTLEETMAYLRIDPQPDDPEADAIRQDVQDLLDAALARADHTLNRGWEPGKVPADIKLAVKQLIAFWDQNRGDTSSTPEQVENTFERYRFLPGL
jgi:hypothetical protein